MSSYHLTRYYKRRQEAIGLLGGKCVICNSIENLEFDHIDAKTKEFAIGKMWSVSKERFLNELKKCQLLCKTHHIEKTLTNSDAGKTFVQHGSISMYRHQKCRCDDCKTVWSEACRRWKNK